MSKNRDTRFQKGRSGNPNGRPRKRLAQSSLYDVIMAQKQVVKQNGVEREVTAEEALQLRVVNDAFAGNAKAIAMVFRWIVEREKWRAARRKPTKTEPEFVMVRERDSDNAFEAMCLLGIASPRAGEPEFLRADFGPGQKPNYARVKLNAWTIGAAFDRMPALYSDEKLKVTLSMQGLYLDQLDRK